MRATRVPFGSVCHLVNGKAFKPSDWSISGLPIIRIQNLNGSGNLFNFWSGSLESQVLVRKGDLLLAWSGTPGTSFGAHIWEGGDAVLNQHIFRCDIDRKLMTPRWAQLTVNAQLDRLVGLAHGGVGLKHVTRGILERLQIPLPPLAEQRRILAILDKAEQLRDKRRAALQKIDALIPAIFIDLFGDPATNARGWQQLPFNELLANIDSGWSPKCLDRPATANEWGILKLGAVTSCEYNPAENKALLPNVPPNPALEVRPGDLLFTRKNTYELVAACALAGATPPRLMMSDLIFRFCLKPKAAVDKCFLHQLLIYPTKRREIQKLAGGSAGSMPNISKEKLRKIAIEVPPLAIQQEFSKRVAAVNKLKSAHRVSMAQMDALLASLQYRAFRGEL